MLDMRAWVSHISYPMTSTFSITILPPEVLIYYMDLSCFPFFTVCWLYLSFSPSCHTAPPPLLMSILLSFLQIIFTFAPPSVRVIRKQGFLFQVPAKAFPLAITPPTSILHCFGLVPLTIYYDFQGQCEAMCEALRAEIPGAEFIQPHVSTLHYGSDSVCVISFQNTGRLLRLGQASGWVACER